MMSGLWVIVLNFLSTLLYMYGFLLFCFFAFLLFISLFRFFFPTGTPIWYFHRSLKVVVRLLLLPMAPILNWAAKDPTLGPRVTSTRVLYFQLVQVCLLTVIFGIEKPICLSCFTSRCCYRAFVHYFMLNLLRQTSRQGIHPPINTPPLQPTGARP